MCCSCSTGSRSVRLERQPCPPGKRGRRSMLVLDLHRCCDTAVQPHKRYDRLSQHSITMTRHAPVCSPHPLRPRFLGHYPDLSKLHCVTALLNIVLPCDLVLCSHLLSCPPRIGDRAHAIAPAGVPSSPNRHFGIFHGAVITPEVKAHWALLNVSCF